MKMVLCWILLLDLTTYQPRSQGSLLPVLRSSVGRVGENPRNEVDYLLDSKVMYLSHAMCRVTSAALILSLYKY